MGSYCVTMQGFLDQNYNFEMFFYLYLTYHAKEKFRKNYSYIFYDDFSYN